MRDENMGKKLVTPLLQCISFCDKLGFRRKQLLFMDKVELYEDCDVVGTVRRNSTSVVFLLFHL